MTVTGTHKNIQPRAWRSKQQLSLAILSAFAWPCARCRIFYTFHRRPESRHQSCGAARIGSQPSYNDLKVFVEHAGVPIDYKVTHF